MLNNSPAGHRAETYCPVSRAGGPSHTSLKLEFRALLKARGGIIDLFGPGDLPSLEKDTIAGIAAGREYCFGEGWVEFIGPDTFPLFTIPGALATALSVLGFSGVLFNARPVKSWRA